jgi:uncharacterized protein YbjQ (UPF0145 family)
MRSFRLLNIREQGLKNMNDRDIALRFLFLSLIITTTSCTTNPDVGTLTGAQRARVASMEIVRGPTTRLHTVLGTVKGLSCHRNAHQQQQLTESEAIEGVKLRAALLDADAVVNLVCQVQSGTDWVNNCWSSVVCVGDAVSYKN